MVMVGCAKNPVDGATFKEVMEEKNFYVIESLLEEDEGASMVESAYYAMGDEYDVDYAELKEEKDAKGVYNIIVREIKEDADSNYKSSSKNSSNFSTFSVTSDGYYHVVTRAGNTIISASYVPEELKGEVEKLFKELGI